MDFECVSNTDRVLDNSHLKNLIQTNGAGWWEGADRTVEWCRDQCVKRKECRSFIFKPRAERPKPGICELFDAKEIGLRPSNPWDNPADRRGTRHCYFVPCVPSDDDRCVNYRWIGEQASACVIVAL